MMSLTFGLFTQMSGSGPLGPLVCFADLTNLCQVFWFSFISQELIGLEL